MHSRSNHRFEWLRVTDRSALDFAVNSPVIGGDDGHEHCEKDVNHDEQEYGKHHRAAVPERRTLDLENVRVCIPHQVHEQELSGAYIRSESSPNRHTVKLETKRRLPHTSSTSQQTFERTQSQSSR